MDTSAAMYDGEKEGSEDGDANDETIERAGNVVLSSDRVPSSVLECMSRDGTINTLLYMKYQEKLLEEQQKRTKRFLEEYELYNAALQKEWEAVGSMKPRATRNRHPTTFTSPDGEVLQYNYTMSEWYRRYVDQPQTECEHWNKLFRRRFRIPYGDFLLLLDMVRDNPLFDRWKLPKRLFTDWTAVFC
jgi:hypothetical protein